MTLRGLRPIAGLVCVVVLCWLPATAGAALTKSQAQRRALALLKPQRENGTYVAVFGLPRAVNAGTTLGEVLGVQPKLRGASWVFWEDLVYGAKFEHPSRLVAIDARSGRVVRSQKLTMWPQIGGKDPPFIARRGTGDARFRIFGRFKDELPVAVAAAAPNPNLYKGECVVLAGDFEGYAFDFKRVDNYYRSRGADVRHLKNADGTTHADDGDMDKLLKELAGKCPDIVIYINGHGKPSGAVSSGTFTVEGKHGSKSEIERLIRPSNWRKTVAALPNNTFKLIVDACYSGQWVAQDKSSGLMPSNVGIAITSANRDEYAWGLGSSTFTTGLMKVMEQSDSIGEDNWSGHQRTIGLIDLGSHNGSDVAAWLGLTHPQRYANANAGPPPAPPDCAATGVKCEKPGASCTSGAECAGSGSLCDAGAICTGNDSICTGPATTCGPGAGDVCTGGATCVGPAAECAGPGTSCTQTTSRCGAGAYCPPSRKTRGRRAPRCVAGTYRSPPMSIVSPHEGNNGNYFFDTPIPNSDYYAHRHGFRSGGCQRLGPSAGDSAPTFKVRIEVYRSDGRLVAARYEFGDGTSRNGRACVVLRPTPSGEPAPVQECRIESPVMGYPFPSQGFVYVDQFTWKDPGIYLTHTVNVAVANAVGDRPDGGAPDSIYIVVQWQPG